jgi:hypothetical protein
MVLLEVLVALVSSMNLVLTVVVALYHLYFFLEVHGEGLQVVQAVWVWIHPMVLLEVLVGLVSSMMVELTVVVVQHYQLYFFLVVHREELEFQVSSTMVEQREVHYLGVHLAVSVVHQVELAVWLLLEDLEDLVALVS